MTERSSGIEKRGIGKKTRIFLAGLATLGAIETAGAITTELTNNQPISITRTIPDDLKWPGTLIENLMNQKVPETFTNRHEGKMKFGENNITRMDTEEAKAKDLLGPKISINSDGSVKVTTLLPGIFPQNIPDTELNIATHAEKDQVPFTEANFIMQEGYQLTLPKDTHYILLSYDPKTSQKPDLVYDIISYYYDKTNDISFMFGFEATGLMPGANQKIIDRKTFNSQYNPTEGGNYENLPKSDGITPIAKPSSSNQNLQVFLFVEKGRFATYSPEQIQTKYRRSVWENFVDQNQKLILISSK